MPLLGPAALKAYLRANWHKPPFLVGYATLLAALLLFFGLGNNAYWDDEANTAVTGRNFLKTGSLSAWDGHNFLAYGMSGAVNIDMEKTGGPPLQYLTAAASLTLFGETTAGGRTLFVLVGLLCIPFVALWYRREFGQEERWWLPALFLALSVAWLLYTRQVRYYPISLTLTFGALWAWAEARRGQRLWLWTPLVLLFFGGLVLSQYLSTAAAAAIVTLGLLRPANRTRPALIVFGVLAGLAIAALIWIALYNPVALQVALALDDPQLGSHGARFLKNLWLAPRDASRFELWPAGLLLVWGGAGLALHKKSSGLSRQIGWSVLYGLAVVVPISWLSPQPVLSAKDCDVRYFTQLMPLAAVTAALLFELLWRARQRFWAPLFAVVLLSSNLLTLNPFGQIGLHSRLLQYLQEQANDYTLSSEAISDYMDAHIPKGQCVFMVPMYTVIIQMFYRPEHTYCGMVSDTAPFAKKHGHELRETLFWERVVPDWYIVGRHDPRRFQAMLDQLYGPGSFALADVLPVHWKNATRPEIAWRSFEPLPLPDPKQGGVLVFKRTSTPAHLPSVPAMQAERALKF